MRKKVVLLITFITCMAFGCSKSHSIGESEPANKKASCEEYFTHVQKIYDECNIEEDTFLGYLMEICEESKSEAAANGCGKEYNEWITCETERPIDCRLTSMPCEDEMNGFEHCMDITLPRLFSVDGG